MRTAILPIALALMFAVQACGGSNAHDVAGQNLCQIELDALESWAAGVLGLQPPVEVTNVGFYNCMCEGAVLIDSAGRSLEICSYQMMFNLEAGPQFHLGACDGAAIANPGLPGSEELRQAALVFEGLWLTRNFDWDSVARMVNKESPCVRTVDPEVIAEWILWQTRSEYNSILVHIIACSA